MTRKTGISLSNISDKEKCREWSSSKQDSENDSSRAISLYKSRDASKKLFRGDKSYLGNKSLRVSLNESAGAKIFIELIALIARCRLYTQLKAMMAEMSKKPNYMTIPAALKELKKIEMVRQMDNVYRFDHAVTTTRKTILEAYGIDEEYVRSMGMGLIEQLKMHVTSEREEEDDAYENVNID